MIEVFMEGLKQKAEHFLRVMLCKTLELNGSSGNNVLDIPWCNIWRLAHIEVI
jgi:hypothetical protein